MSDSCCPGGRCRPPLSSEFTRRGFLQTVVGAAGLAASGRLLPGFAAAAQEAGRPAAVQLPGSWRYPMVPPRVYQAAQLEAVAMPIGGIGTGTVWLDGQGRLSVWQIFNNQGEARIPDSFFAVRVKSGDKPAELRLLQTVGEEPLRPMQSLTFEGGYPIARLALNDPSLPISVRMEAFNPFIPTDAANSSIPCAIFRITAKNTGATPAEVGLIGSCQNAVGSKGSAGIKGTAFAGYGGNRNRALREKGLVALAMEKALEPVETGLVKVRAGNGAVVPGPEMYWFADLPGLTAAVGLPLGRVASAGGTVIAADVQPAFFANLAALRGNPEEMKRQFTVFEDFEKDTYEGWTVTGQAFGKGPATGTQAGQQPVSGYAGKRMVNTFQPDDKPQGTLTSKPFRIERRYIGFLIGGGNHPKQTCINLLVGGKVVRTMTGKDREALAPAGWDVADLAGKEAAIEIVDSRSDGWGHINLDQIVFSDLPPEAVLSLDSPVRAAASAITVPFTAENGMLAAR